MDLKYLLKYIFITIFLFQNSWANSKGLCTSQLTRDEQRARVRVEFQKLLTETNDSGLQKRLSGLERVLLRLRRESLTQEVLEICMEQSTCTEQDIAEATRRTVLQLSKRTNQVKGYAVLIGLMIGSAAVTSHLVDALPKSAKFLSQLIGQLSTIGIYVLGAPIWEPLSSFFRKRAFTTIDERSVSSQRGASFLENLWLNSQGPYSVNAQMSRNVLNQFILSVQQNFYVASRAIDDPASAVDQIAEAATRMRILFAEITPENEIVARMVRATFTRRRADLSFDLFLKAVLDRIYEIDNEANAPDHQVYYQRVLRSWLID